MAAKLRCAIYTRKSSEEGLDQDFNSLHAQREACEAYIKSQVGEGWIALPKAYDDGGFSGGSMERPGLKVMLEDISAGRVDIVVVYKVDRLTRSLADFAKIVDVFDVRGVSFVSVTQAFNTTSSMGRLTLNVLLSFAQFEREVTGERIRDKIAASKAKGMWMGGTIPLGYDVKDRKLVINEAEATTIRRVFQRYLELPSAFALMEELDRHGIRSKRWATNDGREMGGAKFWPGAIYHILRAPVYVGDIVHKDKIYPGLHDPIVTRELFDQVAAKLSSATVARSRTAKAAKGPLKGILFDGDGEPLVPTFGYGKAGKTYRYYVAAQLQSGKYKGLHDRAIRRLSAVATETELANEIARLVTLPALDPSDLPRYLTRVEVRANETHLFIRPTAISEHDPAEFVLATVRSRLKPGELAVLERDVVRVMLPQRLKLRGGAKSLFGAQGAASGAVDRSIVGALRKAHDDLLKLKIGPLGPAADCSDGVAPYNDHGRIYARLAFLAPRIQEQILNGRHPPGLTIRHITRGVPPLAWADQEIWLNTAASAG